MALLGLNLPRWGVQCELIDSVGEMHYEPNGENAGFNLPRDGGIAYAAQEAWVQNETIKVLLVLGDLFV
jgi:hypothetical protein